MNHKTEFLRRMENAARQFKRELEASGAADGVLETIAVEATESGATISFFDTAPKAGRKKKPDSTSTSPALSNPDDQPFEHG